MLALRSLSLLLVATFGACGALPVAEPLPQHLGNSEQHSPAARGFVRSYAVTRGAVDHFGGPYPLVPPERQPRDMYRETGKAVELPKDGFYTSQAFADKLIWWRQPAPLLERLVKEGKSFADLQAGGL